MKPSPLSPLSPLSPSSPLSPRPWLAAAIAACALLSAVACGPASISGDVFGAGFSAADAVTVENERVAGLLNATIAISESSGLCAADAPAEQPNKAFLFVTLYGNLDEGKFDVVDDFAKIDGGTAMVLAGRSNDSCDVGDKDSAFASKGKVTIDTLELKLGSTTSGSLDITLDGENITGTFSAPFCEELTPAKGADTKGCG